jgi:hypothetical protein
MRGLLTLIATVYLFGVAVVLAPNVRHASLSRFVVGVVQDLPGAAIWPVKAYHSLAARG